MIDSHIMFLIDSLQQLIKNSEIYALYFAFFVNSTTDAFQEINQWK